MAEEDLIFGKNRHFFGGIEPSNMKGFSVYLEPYRWTHETVYSGTAFCMVWCWDKWGRMSNRGSSGRIALAVLWPFVLTGYRLQLARLPMKSNTKFWTGISTGYMLLETIYGEQKSDWTRPHPVGFFSECLCGKHGISCWPKSRKITDDDWHTKFVNIDGTISDHMWRKGFWLSTSS